MPFKISELPKERPSGFGDNLADGVYTVAVEKCEYAQSAKGNWMLKLIFKEVNTDKFIFDQIMDDASKAVNGFRLSRLCRALGINLRGESIELRDMTKFFKKGARLQVVLRTTKNAAGKDNQGIDISKSDGYYMMSETVPGQDNVTPMPDVTSASVPQLDVPSDELPASFTPQPAPQEPKLDISSDDDSF